MVTSHVLRSSLESTVGLPPQLLTSYIQWLRFLEGHQGLTWTYMVGSSFLATSNLCLKRPLSCPFQENVYIYTYMYVCMLIYLLVLHICTHLCVCVFVSCCHEVFAVVKFPPILNGNAPHAVRKKFFVLKDSKDQSNLTHDWTSTGTPQCFDEPKKQ